MWLYILNYYKFSQKPLTTSKNFVLFFDLYFLQNNPHYFILVIADFKKVTINNNSNNSNKVPELLQYPSPIPFWIPNYHIIHSSLQSEVRPCIQEFLASFLLFTDFTIYQELISHLHFPLLLQVQWYNDNDLYHRLPNQWQSNQSISHTNQRMKVLYNHYLCPNFHRGKWPLGTFK